MDEMVILFVCQNQQYSFKQDLDFLLFKMQFWMHKLDFAPRNAWGT